MLAVAAVALTACGRTFPGEPPSLVDAGPLPDIGIDGPHGCRANVDCAADSRGHVCDTTTGTCVECTPASDSCPPGSRCSDLDRCVPGCRTDVDCAAGTHCDPTSHACVGCTTDASCAPGTICRSGTCVPGCSDAHPCGAGALCCASTCVDPASDPAHCGSCTHTCGGGQLCCSGGCVDTATDPSHCGSCTRACMIPNATPACVGGTCAVGTCTPGFGDCDHAPEDGCEADITSDIVDCGLCGRVCSAGPFASPRCSSSSCGESCLAGHADCDGTLSDGCETDTTTPANCGGCARVCPTLPNATPTCDGTSCGSACFAGFGDCDGIAMDGCEASLTSDPLDCGGCGSVCTLAHASAGCVASRCTVTACTPGFGDCDGVATDGCETATGTDATNCGTCGHRCALGQVCAGGVCGVMCPLPLRLCGVACVDVSSDAANCGTCGHVCPPAANAVTFCSASTCGLACLRGFDDCDGALADGCETNLETDATHCGACDVACVFPHASGSTCVDSGCRLGTCDGTFADCDGALADGCETDLDTSVAHCGGCTIACATPPHATAACTGGTCGLGTCDAGFADCNGMLADGCETNTRTSPLACGMCGHACMPGEACAFGTCVSTCPPGTMFCSGACIDTTSDPANCGGCGTVCAVGSTCRASSCTIGVPSNDEPSGATPIDLADASQDLPIDTRGATATRAPPCGAVMFGPKDVFFSFTLTRRELVYADTFGRTGMWDTVLYFARDVGGTVVNITGPTTAGDAVCNDDASSVGCGSAGTASQIVALLDPGSYFLVATGFAAASGTGNVRFEHLLASTAGVRLLPAGGSVQTGVTTSPGSLPTACGVGAGGEHTYWWKSCQGGSPGTLHADTCTAAAFDTVLSALSAAGDGDGCDDDGCGSANRSRLTVTIGAASRLHTLQLDGFGATDSGAYTLNVMRP